jgi:hypothetical protein
MIKRLDNYDWAKAFEYAGEVADDGYTDGSANVAAVIGSDAPATPFTREDVDAIIEIADGENDSTPWVGVFHLKDGRYASLNAGCDYTGWDCQASGTARVAWTLEEIIRLGLTEAERDRLDLGRKAPTSIGPRPNDGMGAES